MRRLRVLFVVGPALRKEVAMNADQLRGRLEEIKGRVEAFAGRMFGSRPLVERGKVDFAVGLARAKFGDIKEVVRKRSFVSGRGRDRPAN
jgi:uncharacterized protein YjbJ (UPF0337 family)